jgi:hypothetical protein
MRRTDLAEELGNNMRRVSRALHLHTRQHGRHIRVLSDNLVPGIIAVLESLESTGRDD